MINRKSKIVNGFTLVELLVVISIIGVLAGFTFVTLRRVKRGQFINQTRGEMAEIVSAIDSYHTDYGFYPPDNPGNPLTNQLYYELIGTTNTSAPNVTPAVFQTLDGSSANTSSQLTSSFGGVSAFINCSKHGADEESKPARNYLHQLRPTQTATINGMTVLAGSVGLVDPTYQPVPSAPGVNPWRYRSSGTLPNNPGSYELWIQLAIQGKTNLICNWSKVVQINTPQP